MSFSYIFHTSLAKRGVIYGPRQSHRCHRLFHSHDNPGTATYSRICELLLAIHTKLQHRSVTPNNPAEKKGSERLNPSANQSFECLKEASLSTPIIKHRDPSKPFTLEVDASATALRSVLSQRIWRKT